MCRCAARRAPTSACYFASEVHCSGRPCAVEGPESCGCRAPKWDASRSLPPEGGSHTWIGAESRRHTLGAQRALVPQPDLGDSAGNRGRRTDPVHARLHAVARQRPRRVGERFHPACDVARPPDARMECRRRRGIRHAARRRNGGLYVHAARRRRGADGAERGGRPRAVAIGLRGAVRSRAARGGARRRPQGNAALLPREGVHVRCQRHRRRVRRGDRQEALVDAIAGGGSVLQRCRISCRRRGTGHHASRKLRAIDGVRRGHRCSQMGCGWRGPVRVADRRDIRRSAAGHLRDVTQHRGRVAARRPAALGISVSEQRRDHARSGRWWRHRQRPRSGRGGDQAGEASGAVGPSRPCGRRRLCRCM